MVIALLIILACQFLVPLVAIDAEIDGSWEIINFEGVDNLEMSWISNLVIDIQDDTNQHKTIYFTADRGKSNVYTATFIPNDDNNSNFSSSGLSPLKVNGQEFPAFLTFDVKGKNIVGVTFNAPPTFGVSNVVVGPDQINGSTSFNNQFTFVSVAIDPSPQDNNQSWVYLAGWDNTLTVDAFVVARVAITLGDSQIPSIDPAKDVVHFTQSTGGCYDLFDEKRHPQMWVDGNLTLTISGRCALFARIILPPMGANFSSATFLRHDPTDVDLKYMSSAIYEVDNHRIYYAIKEYNAPSASILSFDTDNWRDTSLKFNLVDMERDAEIRLVYARSPTNVSLYVVGAGSERIEKYVIDGEGLTDKKSVLLEDELTYVSSAYYLHPHLYLTTYEPDAKIARVAVQNFCSTWCSGNGYCSKGECLCKDGYVKDAAVCVRPPSNNPTTSNPTITGLAIMFALALVVAVAGWLKWYKERHSYHQVK